MAVFNFLLRIYLKSFPKEEEEEEYWAFLISCTLRGCIYQVDGKEEEVYTGKLCILAKLFLSSKASKPEVEHFLFYILCEYDDQGYHMVAYFSKVIV